MQESFETGWQLDGISWVSSFTDQVEVDLNRGAMDNGNSLKLETSGAAENVTKVVYFINPNNPDESMQSMRVESVEWFMWASDDRVSAAVTFYGFFKKNKKAFFFRI